MVCAFEGWNDAGEAASGAVSFLASALEARRFAHLDSEEFYDFQSNRPTVAFEPASSVEKGWMCIRPSPCECRPARTPGSFARGSNVGALGSHVPHASTPRNACQWSPIAGDGPVDGAGHRGRHRDEDDLVAFAHFTQ